MIVTTLLTIAVSLVPSIQTILVELMTDSLQAHDIDMAMRWALLTGAFVASYIAIQQVMLTLHRLVQIALRVHCSVMFEEGLARLSPAQIADERCGALSRRAKSAIDDGKVNEQAMSLMSTLLALLVAVSLLLVIGRLSMIAAILVVLGLMPQTISLMITSVMEARLWPKMANASRHAGYHEDLLMYQRSAVELASYDAQPLVAKWAAAWRRTMLRFNKRLEFGSMACDSVAAIISAFLLMGALVALILSGASVGQISGGLVGVFSGIMATNNVGYMVGTLMSSSVGVQSFLEFMSSTEKSDNEVSSTLSSTPPTGENGQSVQLQVEGLSAGYGEKKIVDNASFQARNGQIIAFVGPNGAGKTTLLQAVVGALPTMQGSVYLNGKDCTSQSYAEKHRWFGVLSQDYGRYEITVRDNLLIGTGGRQCDDETLWKALNEAHADAIVRKRGDGLDTQLGEQWGGTGLSGGEWQRLALARLILRNAPIWILDEPTSNVDSQTEAELYKELRVHADSRITIVVSHRAWTLQDMDCIYVVNNGRIVEHGTYDALNREGTFFQQLFNFQTTGSKEGGENNESIG